MLPTSGTSSVRSIEYQVTHPFFEHALSPSSSIPESQGSRLVPQTPTITGAAPFSSNSSPPSCGLLARPPSSSLSCPAAAARQAPRHELLDVHSIHKYLNKSMTKCRKKSRQIYRYHIFDLDLDMLFSPKTQPLSIVFP